MHSRLLSLLAAVLLLGAACEKNPMEPVAKVGPLEIQAGLVSELTRVNKHFKVQDPDEMAMAQLVLGFLANEVGRRYGLAVTQEAGEAYYQQLKYSPESPYQELERQAKYEEAYRVAVIMNELPLARLQFLFDSKQEPHLKEIEKVNAMHARALAQPRKFDAIGAEYGAEVQKMVVGAQGILSLTPETYAWNATTPPDYAEETHAAGQELYARLGSTPAGSVYVRPIVAPNSFQVVKVDERRQGAIAVSILSVERRYFFDWFWTEAGSIPVRFMDRGDEEDFREIAPWSEKVLIER